MPDVFNEQGHLIKDNGWTIVLIARLQKFMDSSQISIGDLIRQLSRLKEDKPIKFKDGNCPYIRNPIHSYRGYYDECAIRSKPNGIVTNRKFVNALSDSTNKVYCGWKGRLYTYFSSTPVWYAQRGSCGEIITGVTDKDDYIEINTEEYKR